MTQSDPNTRDQPPPSSGQTFAYLWQWLISVRIGIFFLAVMAILSIIGTLIPPLTKDGEVIISALKRSQDLVYYTWWFQTLLLILALNILCSGIEIFRTKVLVAYRPRKKTRLMRMPAFYRSAGLSKSFAFKGSADQVEAALNRQGFSAENDGEYGYGMRGRLRLWGAPLSHIGMVMVLLGGFATKWVAQEGIVTIVEGRQAKAMTQTVPLPQRNVFFPGFTLDCEDFETEFFPKTTTPAMFISTITARILGKPPRTEKVEVNNSMAIGGWRIHQTSYQEVPNARRWLIAVAHAQFLPSTVTLELSQGQTRSLGRAGDLQITLKGAFPPRWSLTRAGQKLSEGALTHQHTHDHAQQTQATPSSAPFPELRLKAAQFEPHLMIGADMKATSLSRELRNPGLRVTLIEQDSTSFDIWLFGREELKAMSQQDENPYELELVAIDGDEGARQFVVTAKRREGGTLVGEFRLALGEEAPLARSKAPSSQGAWRVNMIEPVMAYATTLTLTRNPMIPIIYFSCMILVLGLMLAFFIRRREVWYWVDSAQGALHVVALYFPRIDSFDSVTRSALARAGATAPADPPAIATKATSKSAVQSADPTPADPDLVTPKSEENES
jgi:cytochrome c biogenesis protein ResB